MLPRNESYITLKGCLGVSRKRAWVSPEVSGGPGHRGTAVKKPLRVSCRERLTCNLFTFLLTAESLFSPGWLGLGG